MDNRKLVRLVQEYPQIWDRNSQLFRDKEAKDKTWGEVAAKMDVTVEVCKDTFKSLREKYLREREKSHNQGDYYKSWELIEDLKFLDPHIMARTSSWNACDSMGSEDDTSINSDVDQTDFDTKLISLVKNSSSIWDRNSNTYPNKSSKNQLWSGIAASLNRDVNSCMLRWKALREKYIRQRAKFMEGDAKWELLDHLSFLDKVIQYRRKQSDFFGGAQEKNRHPSESLRSHQSYDDVSTDYNHIRCNTTEDNSNHNSSNNFLSIVKEESSVVQRADSSYNTRHGAYSKKPRRDSVSSNSETIGSEKRLRVDEGFSPLECKPEKSPEQLFGDLVASLLSKKPENQRNLYMIEVMTVLSK